MDNKTELKFNAIITEYNAMKTESMAKLQFQITLISLYITVLGTVFSLSLNNMNGEDTLFDNSNMFCFVVPCITVCIAAIWIDQTYRQIKIAYYLSLLEEKINRLLGVDNDIWTSAMFWEHWLRNHPMNTNKFNASRTFYYICMGVFSVAPIASYFYGFFNTEDFNRIIVQTVIVSLGYVIYLAFTCVYVHNILMFNNKVK